MVPKPVVRGRLKLGWSWEEAHLPKAEFDKLSAQKKGKHKVRGYNLRYVCEKAGLNYDNAIHWLNRNPESDIESYFKLKEVDLNELLGIPDLG